MVKYAIMQKHGLLAMLRVFAVGVAFFTGTAFAGEPPTPDSSDSTAFAPFSAPNPAPNSSISYSEYTQYGVQFSPRAPFIGGGELKINRDSPHAVPVLQGLLASQLGVFIAVGAGIYAVREATGIGEERSPPAPPVFRLNDAECQEQNPREIHAPDEPDGCRPPVNTAECMRVNPGELYGEDIRACRPPNTTAECMQFNPGEIYDEDGGSCRLPMNDAECMALVLDEIYLPDEADNCGDATPNNTQECMAKRGAGMIYDSQLDDCRFPENDAECMAVAAGQIFISEESDNCRFPVDNAECMALVLGEIFVAGESDNCRLPMTDAECDGLVAGEVFDISESDNCRPKTGSEVCLDAVAVDAAAAEQRRVFTIQQRITINQGVNFRRFAMNTHRATVIASGVTLTTNTYSEFIRVAAADYRVEGGMGIGGPVMDTGLRAPTPPRQDHDLDWRQRVFLIVTINSASVRVTHVRQNDFRGYAATGEYTVNFGDGRPGFSIAPKAGDVLAVGYLGTNDDFINPGIQNASFTATLETTTPPDMRGAQLFRLYRDENDPAGELRLAVGENDVPDRISDTRSRGGSFTRTDLAPDAEFTCVNQTAANKVFIKEDWTTTNNFDEADRTEFLFQEAAGGMLNKNNAARAGGFAFAAGENLKNMHVEYSLPEAKSGEITWRTYSGYSWQDGGKTRMVYYKTTAGMGGKNWQLYAQAASGRIYSQIYTPSAISGAAAGLFYANLFRHDDSYYIRLHSPFTEDKARAWSLSADAQIGGAGAHVYLGISRNMKEGKTKAKIQYRRRF